MERFCAVVAIGGQDRADAEEEAGSGEKECESCRCDLHFSTVGLGQAGRNDVMPGSPRRCGHPLPGRKRPASRCIAQSLWVSAVVAQMRNDPPDDGQVREKSRDGDPYGGDNSPVPSYG